jgi:mutator protein MutT
MNRIIVAAAVIIEDRHVLIARRAEGELAGLWEFPGGKIESGETVRQGLEREIAEELCLEINVEDFLTATRFQKNDTIIDLHAYFCVRKSRKDQVLMVHSETAWVNRTTIQKHTFIPADMVFVEKLISCGFL